MASCTDCRFYREKFLIGPDGQKKSQGGGNCRRYPPRIAPPSLVAEYPTVHQDDWCGEHRPME